MITDHRPDTLTPRLKELQDLDTAIPQLLDAAKRVDPQLSQIVRHAMRDVRHYHCPLGWSLEGGAWVFVFGRKLLSPNKISAHFMLQQAERRAWERLLQSVICSTLKVASWEFLKTLNRQPRCVNKMTLQIVRLVPSSREFIRDDDNLGSARKQWTDAAKRCGLMKDDRREWLQTLPIYQDVSPPVRIDGEDRPSTPFTVCFLWPTTGGRLAF